MKLVIEISDRDAACLFKDEWDGQRWNTLAKSIEADVETRAQKFRHGFALPDLAATLQQARAAGFIPTKAKKGRAA